MVYNEVPSIGVFPKTKNKQLCLVQYQTGCLGHHVVVGSNLMITWMLAFLNDNTDARLLFLDGNTAPAN